MATLSQQAVGDWRLTLAPNLATGEVTADLTLTPQGDLALVTGIDRLVQMVILWLLTPQGQNPWDPTYGNPFYTQLGRPTGPDYAEGYLAMLAAAEEAFLTHQDQAARAGQLTPDELVDHFSDETVRVTGAGQLTLSFSIHARSGVGTAVNLPFAAGLAAGQAL